MSGDPLAHCPYCSYRVSVDAVTLWDARTYCRRCVEEVSPALYDFAVAGGRLIDTLDQTHVSALRFVLYLGKWYLAFVALFFGLPCGLIVLNGKANPWGLAWILGIFGGGGMIFLSLQSLVGVAKLRSFLPRKVSVEGGQLLIKTSKDATSVALTDCKWYFGSTTCDEACIFADVRHGVIIQTPQSKVAVGHNHEILEHWRAFFSLTKLPQNPPHGCLRLMVLAGIGLIVGVLVGASIGYVVSMITNNNVWTAVLGLIGAMEGCAVALMITMCTTEGAEAARERLRPALVGLAFFVVGIKFGLLGGWLSALICGSINSIFGVFVALYCRAKIDATEAK